MPMRSWNKGEGPGMAGEVVRFADFLKARGFRVFQSSVHDALRSVQEIDLSRREDFLLSLRVNMAKSDLEWAQFSDLFEEFWERSAKEPTAHPEKMPDPLQRAERTHSEGERVSVLSAQQLEKTEDPDKRAWLEGVAYSPVASVERKDLSRFDRQDIQVAHLALKRMVAPFRIDTSRRSKRSRRHKDVDFPRIMRRSLKTEGIPVTLFYRQKKQRLKRLVILADVSGSMDRYARFVMPFLLGLRGVGSKAEVFAFSTSLTGITFMVRHLPVEKALERMASTVPDWSGGTRIGHSLHQFNEQQGERLLGRRTVVVILSDGWDLGGKDLLKREMAALSRKAHCVIWLNPLAADPKFRPMSQGMRVAMPYVDHFLPVNSLESLKRVGRLLARVMIH